MQKITDAAIYKNARILLGEDCNIKYRPQSAYQVIIGQNGVGKTSFLTNLIAYPNAGSKVFHKTGYSTITYQVNDDTIVTTQRHDGKYSFMVNNTEMNAGGTRGIQCELFADYLHITPLIQQILDPDFDFLAMRPNQRQEFLSKLTTGDLSFALMLHKRLEQRSRQYEGTAKRLEVNLNELKMKALSEEEYQEHTATLKAMQTDMTQLYMDTSADVPRPVQCDLEALEQRITDLNHNITDEWKKVYPWGRCAGGSLLGAEALLSDMQNRLTIKDAQLQGLMDQFELFNSVKESLVTGNVDNIDAKIAVLEAELAKLPDASTLLPIFYPTPMDYRNAIKDLENTLHAIEYPITNITGEWSENLLQCDLGALQDEIKDVQNRLYKLDAEVSQLDERLAHVHSGEVRCPDCGSQFNPQLDAASRRVTEDRKSLLLAARPKGETLLEELTARYQQASGMRQQYSAILQRVSHTNLRPIMDYVNSVTSLLANPTQWLTVIRSTLDTLRVRGHIAEIEDDYNIIQVQRNLLAEKNIESTQALSLKTEQLEYDIWQCQQDILALRKEIKYHSQRIAAVQRYQGWVKRINQEYLQVQRDLDALAKWEVNQCQKEVLEQLQLSIAELSAVVNNYEQQASQIKCLEEMVASEKALAVASRLSANELSPKTGIIAEQLSGFIGGFLNDVMEICNAIWTYDVSIYLAKDSAKSLTYLFPVEFNHSGIESEDIAKTSKGQYSLINSAVKITALRYLGYHNAPLFLDEPDGDIHPIHKVKMMNFIKVLVEEEVFSQVFLISHHESGWGALPNLDLIDFSKEYNHANSNSVITFT